ncbi:MULTISPECIES: hypothetical protein [Haloferax]|uniref:Uncharacterized protein n=1 Tax=Haloferax mediterranei (strain ATCC 33500 / DSM 1411 / JCM 8866 / NBRC 14739 / NCIMB 2177 / R-4) TaxID=523841 RepID=M0IVE6_HALMT|nr:hypothetical protein [Haloferax mediterranei]ELZ99997.1 hypothetical protein C439_11698 [Haloferax mediterranei ATCC 33500]MDX5987581.1 hypothetical protein [Haloferax mediterranei ATCC 33500]
MNRATAVAAGAASGYGVAVFAAIAVFFQDMSGSVSVAVAFGVVTLLATFAVTRVTHDK